MELYCKNSLDRAELAFQEIENGKDVYKVKKSRGYGSGWYYLESGSFVSGRVINNLLKEFNKVVVFNSKGNIIAKNFL